jgi:dihydroorotase
MRLIKNAKIIKNDEILTRDVLFDRDKILKVQECIDVLEDYEVYDAKGCYLLPSLIDLNVRLANSVLTKSNLDKLSISAKKGAVTTAVIRSDFIPRLDSPTLLDFLKLSFEKVDIDLNVTAPLRNDQTDKLNDIARFINNGAVAIWTESNINSNFLKRGMQYAYMKNRPLFCFCYDSNLDDLGLVNEGKISSKLGLSGISKFSESAEVAKVAELCVELNPTVVFQTISTKRSLEIIKSAKKRSKNLYSEVSIHHLIKNDSCCDGFNTYAKILPPLREEAERLKLIEALKDGDIDILTSFHSPKSVLYKDVAFWDAHFGIGAIEEFFKLSYTFLVKKEGLSLQRLIELCSINPAKILKLENRGKIEVGYRADMFIFDPNHKELVDNKNSIYTKDELFGDIKKVFISSSKS